MTDRHALQVLRGITLRGQVAPGAARRPTGIELKLQEAPEIGARPGYDDGYAAGRADGLARAEDEMRRTAAQAAAAAEGEFAARVGRAESAARQEARDAVRHRIEAIERLLAALPPQIEARLHAAEDDLLVLCFETVCRVLGERATDVAAVRAQVDLATKELRGRSLVAVHLHPRDLAVLQDDPSWTAREATLSRVQWVGNRDVALGGCIVQSPEGSLDARLETRMRALAELLCEVRMASPSEVAPPTAEG